MLAVVTTAGAWGAGGYSTSEVARAERGRVMWEVMVNSDQGNRPVQHIDSEGVSGVCFEWLASPRKIDRMRLFEKSGRQHNSFQEVSY